MDSKIPSSPRQSPKLRRMRSARMAYANMEDYTRLDYGEGVVDLSAANRDHLAAVQEIVIEDFKDGSGENARDCTPGAAQIGF